MSLLSALILATAHATPTPQTGNIEVPIRVGEHAIIVDAKVNGRDLSFMFDTGFSGSVLVDGVNIGPASGQMTLRDFVGQIDANTVKIKTFAIGAKTINTEDVSDAVSMSGGDYSFAYNTHVDGIMGFDAVKDSVLEINFQRQKFIFHPNTEDISKRVPDNKRTFLIKLLPLGSGSLELPVETQDGKRMVLALDTGNSFYVTTHKEVLERVGLWKSGAKPKYISQSGVASGAVDSWDIEMPPVKIYGVPVAKSYWDIIDAPKSSADHDGTVGFGFLKNFNITVDYNRRRVWLENFTDKVENEPPGQVGLSAAYSSNRKRTVVYWVSPDSPAAKAGIKEGDEVLSVDGQELINAGYRKMRELMEGVVGSKVKLAMSRNGNLVRYELERVPLVNVANQD